MPSLYPGARARLIPRRTSFNASRRSAGSAARYSVTVDAGMGPAYHEGFCRGNSSVRIRLPPTALTSSFPIVGSALTGEHVAHSVRLQNCAGAARVKEATTRQRAQRLRDNE